MNTSLFIAKRYFLSAKKRSFINVISIISMLTVAVGTMSLVVVLSVFNGMEDLIRSLYGTFDPEIKIMPVEGKAFYINDTLLNKLKGVEGVDYVSEIIEDNALLRYQDKQIVVKLKGVTDNFKHQNRMDSMIVDGNYIFKRGKIEYAIIGRGIQNQMSVNIRNRIYPLQLWYPRVSRNASLNPESAFNRDIILPEGVFAIEKQYDDHYIFVPISFCERLMNYEGKRTSLEVKTVNGQNINRVIARIKEAIGDKFKVLNADEQHASLIKAVKIEKIFVILTFALILTVASINIFFSLSMLVIEKQRDIAVLMSIGASRKDIRNIFIIEGALIAFSGAIVGLLTGLGICLAQIKYGLVSMGMETSLVDNYPVKLMPMDFAITATIIVVVTMLVSIPPALNAQKLVIKDNLNK